MFTKLRNWAIDNICPRTVRGKFLVTGLPIALVFTIAVFALYVLNETSHSQKELQEKSQRIVDTNIGVLTDSVWNMDDSRIDLILAGLESDPDFSGAAVLTAEGEPFASRGTVAGTDDPLTSRGDIVFVSDSGTTERIGEFVVSLSDDAMWEEIREHLISEVILVALLLASIVADTVIAYRRAVGVPLERLLGAIHAKVQGDTVPKIQWNSRDEIGIIISAFNDLMKTQKRVEGVRRKAQEELERQVELRTWELKLELGERTRAENALRASERRLKEIAETSSDWFWEMDADLRLTSFSERYQSIFGVPPEANLGKKWDELELHDLDEEVRLSFISRLEAHEPFRDFRYERTRPDGSVVHVSLNGMPVFDDLDEFLGYRGTGSDISAEVEAHERAEIAAAQLRQSLKMEAVGQLTGGIAHDFNNLLMVIDGYAKRARNSAGGQTELIAAMDQVLSASNRGADLIRQLLTFSRRQTVEKSAFSVEERLGEIRDLLSRSIGELYELRFEIGAADLCIETDPGEFDQAIMNLVINARDASRAGGIITIRAEAVELGSEAAAAYPDISPGPFVRLSVIDEGQGISDENLQHVFEPFFTTKEQGQGTGLGLATVYGMVRQSGGMAEIESALGVGTKVRLYLPSVDRPGLRAAAEVESEAQGHGETILLVEDDTALLALMKDTVSALGYNVLTADGGFTALEVESDYEGEIDLLLSDVIMPSITGPEVAKMLQELRPNIRVVLMSGYPARARQQVEIPPDTPLLQKPFKTPELAATLRQELEYLKKNAA